MNDESLILINFLNIGNFITFFCLVDYILKRRYLLKIDKFQNESFKIIKSTKVKKIYNSIDDNIVIGLIVGICSFLFDLGIIVEDINLFFEGWFFELLAIFLLVCFVRFALLFLSEDFLELKRKYKADEKLFQISSLIDALENRKEILLNYDKNDKYRSEEVLKSEIIDIDKSIDLLKRMYSYLELNNSIAKVNRGFDILKNTSLEKDKISEFQKEIDILNAQRDLNKNIDSSLEDLKKKYR